jgi:hypothetical protein
MGFFSRDLEPQGEKLYQGMNGRFNQRSQYNKEDGRE